MSSKFEWDPFLTDILKNYKGIHEQLYIHAGSQVGTMDKDLTIFSFTNLASEIPQDIPIFSLPSFLLYIGLFETPMVEFFIDNEDDVDHIIISDKMNPKRIFKYNLASTREIENIKKVVIQMYDSNNKVTLLESDIQSIIKAANNLESTFIEFTLNNNKLNIKTIPRIKNSHSLNITLNCDHNSEIIPQVKDDETAHFMKENEKYYLDINQLRNLYKGDYIVDLFEDAISLRLIDNNEDDKDNNEVPTNAVVNYCLLFLDEDSI